MVNFTPKLLTTEFGLVKQSAIIGESQFILKFSVNIFNFFAKSKKHLVPLTTV